MIGYLVSLIMGLAVGVAYGRIQVQSPAPPLIPLIGLLGMVLGSKRLKWSSTIFRPPSPRSGKPHGLSANHPSQSARWSPS